MHKILIFSDSHGSLNEMNKIIADNADCELILHAGDYAADIYRAQTGGKAIICVAGNCDRFSGGSDAEEERIIPFGKEKIFLTHGHTYNVKQNCDILLDKAASAGCTIAVYGHTHVPEKRSERGVIVINPGSISAVKAPYGSTYAELILDDDGRLDKAFVKVINE